MKVLLCCIGKEENQYIREYVEYYKSLNFDNIWLYDNNDPEGERFEDVISDYIASGFVVLKDYRGRKVCQLEAYNECYNEAGNEYDWIAFFDCDEFLTLVKKKNIHHELALSKFKTYDAIHVNWMNYGDGGLLYNDGRPLQERITKPLKLTFKKMYNFPENYHVKTIVRTKLPNVRFGETTWSHSPDGLRNCCDTDGEKVNPALPFCKMKFEDMYLRHYSTKTTEEYIAKIKKGFPDRVLEGPGFYSMMVDIYFRLNEKTSEKIAMFEKELGIKVSTKRNDIQIYMLCYAPKPYGFLDNDVFTPLQCGAATSGYDTCALKDNTGDNISAANFIFVENTGTYWIWKNVHGLKYKGQMQYRRRLQGIDENTDFDKIFSEYDVITCEPFHHPDHKVATPEEPLIISADTVQQGYAFSNCGFDLDVMEKVVKSMYPEYSRDWDKYINNGPDLYYSSGFILKEDDYDKYCEFFFPAANEYLRITGIKDIKSAYAHVGRNLGAGKYQRYPNPYEVPMEAISWQTEILGFLGERMWTVWLLHNFADSRILKLPYIKMENGMYT